MLVLQLVGAVFGLVMLYFTYHFYQKNTYTYRSLTMWFFVWIAFILFTLRPDVLAPLTRILAVQTTLELFIIGSLFVFSGLVFYLYVTVKKTEKRVDDLVSELAKQD